MRLTVFGGTVDGHCDETPQLLIDQQPITLLDIVSLELRHQCASDCTSLTYRLADVKKTRTFLQVGEF